MAKKPKTQTVTMKLNRNGTMTVRSTGGYDLMRLVPAPSANPVKEAEK